MKKQKIIFFIYRLGGGGASRTFLNIINHLDRKHFEPILVTLDFSYNYEQYVKDDVKFIKLKTKRLRKAIFPLAKVIKAEQPDLVMSTIPVYNTVLMLAKLFSRTKTKVVIREAAYLGGTTKENIKLKLFGLIYRTADQVIALSNGVKDNLLRRYGVKESKITVIYNPVDIDHITNESLKDINEERLFNENRQFIITAGRLVAEKDQATLIKAFAQIYQETNSELIILGEGELESELRQLATELRVDEFIHFLGFKKNPYAYFKRSDIFALTSINEGFGHVLVEALATELPVMTTKCEPGASEVLANGEYGLLANVGDVEDVAEKLHYLLDMPAIERAEIIAKGKKRAASFHVKTIVAEYEDMFLRVLNYNKCN